VAEKTLKCVVVTPERSVLDVPADYVSVPLFDGEMGVLPGRAALVGRLGYGELRVRRGNQTQHLYLEGGFVQVRDNTVTLLTPRALMADEIQPDVIREQLEASQATPGAVSARQMARAKLRVARKKKS
jgi:F-type H+-transporting ATPase subunit epsilon